MTIEFRSNSKLTFPESFYEYSTQGKNVELTINVQNSTLKPTGKILFDAEPTEMNGLKAKWNIRRHKKKFSLNYLDFNGIESSIVFNYLSDNWEIFCADQQHPQTPMFFPFGNLVLFQIITKKNSLALHASSIIYEGEAYVFFGHSGKGKTTLSKLWEKHAKIIHDDIVIITKEASDFYVHNAPVSRQFKKYSAPLKKIFMIEHGRSNKLTKLSLIEATMHLSACSIQHNYSMESVQSRIQFVHELSSAITTCKLDFVPNESIIDFLKHL